MSASARRRFAALLPLLLCAGLLCACGGGGGGGGGDDNSVYRQPLAELAQDTEPSGARIDVSTRDFFVVAAGDRAEYDGTAVATESAVVVVREVTTGPDSQGRFTLRESVSAQSGFDATVTEYQRRVSGLVELNFFGSDATAGLRTRVPEVLKYPTPFFPAGSTRTVVRQGSLDEDLDGDGRNDSFRFEFEQQFIGFESGQRGGRAEQRARFKNRLLLRIVPSRPDRLVGEVIINEEAVFADRVGLISARVTSILAGSVAGDYRGPERLRAGTLAGRNVDTAWNGSTTQQIALQHHDLVYDGVGRAYYAGTTLRDATAPGRVVRIDPQTGALTQSPALGNDVRSVAVSADGSTLYAGVLDRAEIIQLSLPSLAIVRSIPIERGVWPFGMAVSPSDAGTLAYLSATGVPRLVRNGVLQPVTPRAFEADPQFTNQMSVFAADGSQFYMLGRGASGNVGILGLPVLSNGLSSPASSAAVLVGVGGSLDRSAAGIVAGLGLYAPANLQALARSPVADLTDCRPLPASSRWVCRSAATIGFGRIGLVEAPAYGLVEDGLIPYVLPAPGQYGVGPVVRVVPGSPGQVAVMQGGEAFWFGDWVVLVNNADFR